MVTEPPLRRRVTETSAGSAVFSERLTEMIQTYPDVGWPWFLPPRRGTGPLEPTRLWWKRPLLEAVLVRGEDAGRAREISTFQLALGVL